MKKITLELIAKCEDTGLRVHAISSDMGSDNRAMWKSFGIKGKKIGKIISSIPHPVRSDDELCFIADVPHLFKRIRLALTTHRFIFLPEDIVKEFNLPTNVVSTEHIKELVDFEKGLELKVAFRLRESDLGKVGQYEKMQMSGARRVICQRTYVGLQLLSKKKPYLKTTAWFVKLANSWFDIMTSRSPALALRLANRAIYHERIRILRLTIRVFRSMKVGKEGRWMPVQEGVLISTNSILKLQEKFLKKLGYCFF